MKLAICDDETMDREHIKHFVGTHNVEHEVFEFDSAVPLLKSINSDEHFDVLFLDIQMPDSNGWEVAEQLKRAKCQVYIAMVTINENYIYDCFDRVDWFTPKPVSEAKIHKILNNAYDKLFPTVLEFVIDKMPVALTPSEIIYVEVKRNYIYVHTTNSTYKMRESLCNVNKQFDLPGFTSTHQSYLLNLDYYVAKDDSQVVLKNGEKIPLSRGKIKLFDNALREHVRRRKSNV